MTIVCGLIRNRSSCMWCSIIWHSMYIVYLHYLNLLDTTIIHTHPHTDPIFTVSSEQDHAKQAFTAHTSMDRIVSSDAHIQYREQPFITLL